MLLSLGVFTVCNVLSVTVSSFEALLALRVIPVAFHPPYASMALAVASQTDTPDESARASARVFVGVSGGMVVGAPVAALVASLVSFEASMAFFAVATAADFVMTRGSFTRSERMKCGQAPFSCRGLSPRACFLGSP